MIVDPARLLAYLIAKRDFYGADTKVGHRCSNILELLGNRRGAAGDQIINIDKSLAVQIQDLERLSAAGG